MFDEVEHTSDKAIALRPYLAQARPGAHAKPGTIRHGGQLRPSGLAPDEHANAVNVANLKRVLGLALLGSGGKTKGKQEVVAYFLTIRIIRTGAAEHYGTNGGLKGATCSRDEVRRHDADELAGHDPLSSPPESRKMSLVPRHQVIGASGIDAFQEYVVVRVRRHLEPLRRSHAITAALDELEELLAQGLANFEIRAGEHGGVLGNNSLVDVEPGRYDDVGVEYEAERIIRVWTLRHGRP